MCIRFGMVSDETDVEELLNLVVTAGQQLDEQLVELNQMGDLVRKGIEQAADDLRKESDEAIWQEGVLRHVPLVGSLYNWLSPIQKPQIKGRFLSLNEGKLQSTEIIYQHAKGIADEHVLTKNNPQETQEEVVVEESAEKKHETAQETDKDIGGKVDGVQAWRVHFAIFWKICDTFFPRQVIFVARFFLFIFLSYICNNYTFFKEKFDLLYLLLSLYFVSDKK